MHGVVVRVRHVVVAVDLLADDLVEDAFVVRQTVGTVCDKCKYVIGRFIGI